MVGLLASFLLPGGQIQRYVNASLVVRNALSWHRSKPSFLSLPGYDENKVVESEHSIAQQYLVVNYRSNAQNEVAGDGIISHYEYFTGNSY